MRSLVPSVARLLRVVAVVLLAFAAGGAVGPSSGRAAGSVEVALPSEVMRQGDPVAATVRNGLDAPIYTQDEKSDCTILLLLHWDGAAWQPVPGCGLRRLARVFTVQPGGSMDVTIDPSSPALRGSGSAGTPALGPGWYCLELSFSRTPIGAGEPEPEIVFSDLFYIWQ